MNNFPLMYGFIGVEFPVIIQRYTQKHVVYRDVLKILVAIHLEKFCVCDNRHLTELANQLDFLSRIPSL